MSIFFAILVRIASYGPQIDQSHGENRLSHIIIKISIMVFRRYGVLIVWLEVEDRNAWGIYSQLWTEKYREKTRTLYQSRWWPSFNSGQVRKLKFFLLKGYRSLCQMTQLRSAPERAVLAAHEKQTDWQFNISGTSRRSYIITSFLKAKEDVTIIFPTTVLDDIGLIFADQFTG